MLAGFRKPQSQIPGLGSVLLQIGAAISCKSERNHIFTPGSDLIGRVLAYDAERIISALVVQHGRDVLVLRLCLNNQYQLQSNEQCVVHPPPVSGGGPLWRPPVLPRHPTPLRFGGQALFIGFLRGFIGRYSERLLVASQTADSGSSSRHRSARTTRTGHAPFVATPYHLILIRSSHGRPGCGLSAMRGEYPPGLVSAVLPVQGH